MAAFGRITIIGHPDAELNTSYTLSELDGRISVNGWKKFMKQRQRQIGQKMLFMIYIGNAGNFLFVSDDPEVALQ